MTIFAYGQTSTGKTYTMQGNPPENEGIIPLTLKEIFEKIKNAKDIINSKISVSFIEIYNESINDLLDNNKINLDLRETSNKEVIVNNLTEIKINNHEEALNLLSKGNESRIVASTKLNEKSSRSHSIFRLNVEITKKKENKNNNNNDYENENEKIILKSHINLIDLAGSENSSKTGCVGQRLKEGSNINKSLLALSNVINKLSQNNGNNSGAGGGNFFVNYRDSKLTRLLQNSLGGNSKTAIICTITDDSEHYTETMNTLHFGNKAKNIKTVIKVNEIKNQNCQQMLLENERLKKKLKELEKELTSQKKLRFNEMLLMTENNNIHNNLNLNKDINLTAPPKINLNSSFLLCNTSNKNKNDSSQTFKNSFKEINFNRTQLALSNMERELSLLKKYLLTDQKENINNNINNNYVETSSLRSSDICRNLMYSNAKNNKPNFYEFDNSMQNMQTMKFNTQKKVIKSSSYPLLNNNISLNLSLSLCKVENFVLNENKGNSKDDKNDKIKKLEEENNRLKYELSLIKNNNSKEKVSNTIDLEELSEQNKSNSSLDDKKKKQEYFLNKGRKVLLSKFSKIKFNNNSEDTQVLIQMNQTIKNLNQNIKTDNVKENNFLQKKKFLKK